MSNPSTKAFRYPIGSSTTLNALPIAIGLSTTPEESAVNAQGETIGLINQSSPTWVLTIVRWKIRDTLRTPTSNPSAIVGTIVVENDCISVNISDNKGVLTPNMSALLLESDINYSDAVHPGDFVFVNMLNWEADARTVATKARNGQPINEQSDGFKGIYKVQSVRKTIGVDPVTGIKTALYKIDGFAFTEFNNTVYFNPNLINKKGLENQALYLNDISSAWASYLSKDGFPALQDTIAFLIQTIIGSGVSESARMVNGLVVSPNAHYLVPILVGKLLGVTTSNTPGSTDFSSVIAAKDIYNYIFGIQQFSPGQNQTLTTGMNPSNISLPPQQKYLKYPGFWYTNQACTGHSLLKPEYWNQVQLWAIVNQYTNSPMNELYTCFKVSPGTGRIMPTVVFRQIPFTSEDFVTQKLNSQDENAPTIAVTQFLSLPRWVLHSGLVFKTDLGTDEAARINFVQYYAKSNLSRNGVELSNETAAQNYTYDKDDIARNGLRPYVVQNQFDDLAEVLVKNSPIWARILGDALIGGHLKVNGSIEAMGVVEPVAVGDNLEFDGVVYHIEQIMHHCNVNPQNGTKNFRTTFHVSHGVSVTSSSKGTKYSQMAFPNAYADRINDFTNEQILPGISESQDVVSRNAPTNPDARNTTGSQVAGFPQPTLIKNKKVTGK